MPLCCWCWNSDSKVNFYFFHSRRSLEPESFPDERLHRASVPALLAVVAADGREVQLPQQPGKASTIVLS